MKRIFWVLALGALASAAMAVGLSRAADLPREGAKLDADKVKESH